MLKPREGEGTMLPLPSQVVFRRQFPILPGPAIFVEAETGERVYPQEENAAPASSEARWSRRK